MTKLISWVEIPAADFTRAVNFYNKVFKLNLEPMDWGEEKMACFPGGEGAISFAPGFNPSESGTLVSFQVRDSIEETISRIQAEGGRVLQPKTKIEAEGRGWFCTFLDSEGNKVGLYQDK
ncbi:MAG: VOC family protein [Bacteroidota bacterium]